MSPMDESAAALAAGLRRELAALPTTHWRYLFPVSVAAWHHLHERFPAVFDELDAGFEAGGKPWFAGRGARWFVRNLQRHPRFAELGDAIMDQVIDALGDKVQDIDILEEELPEIDPQAVAELARLLEEEARRAIGDGQLA